MIDRIRRGMQERNLQAIARSPKGFQFTDTFFPYTSGQIGPYYVQSAGILANPSDYKHAIADITLLTHQTLGGFNIDYLAGGESRDWIFSLKVAINLGKPAVMIYKDGKVLPDIGFKGKNIAIVSDLNNEGSSQRDKFVPAMDRLGAKITHATFYVDRLEDGVEVLDNLGIKNNAVVPLNPHAWDYLQKIEVVDSEVYKNLRGRGESRQSRHDWAIQMLRSDRGFAKLTELFTDSKTEPKVRDILKKGYPEIRKELVERLVEIAPQKKWEPGYIRETLGPKPFDGKDLK